MKLKKIRWAMKVLSKAISEDEGYRISWESNIAVSMLDAFMQEFERDGVDYKRAYKAANDGACRFLSTAFNVRLER